jgi:acetylornithine deacetylase
VILENVKSHEVSHINKLREGLRASLKSLEYFQAWIAESMRQIGMQVDEFIVGYEELANQPACQKTLKTNPSHVRQGLNLVGHLPGCSSLGQGILLYAHADKFPETYEWANDQADMIAKDGRLYGLGIADDVSGITAILSSLETLKRLDIECGRDLLVASVLGKQLSVLGTYGLMTRYGPIDAAIYVHPAESGNGLMEIHMASNGLIEFHITIEGQGPHTTDPFQTLFALSAENAADKGVYLFTGLKEWASKASKKYYHSGLEKLTGQAFSLLFSMFTAGTENLVYEIPLRCVLKGTLSFPPNANLKSVQYSFKEAFQLLVNNDPWLSNSHVDFEWGDHIGESAQSDEQSALLQTASRVLEDVTGIEPHHYFGYALSDIRYPILYWNAQALGFGPLCGDIGKKSEWIDQKEYIDTIIAVSQMLQQIK